VARNHDAAGKILSLSTSRSFTYDDRGRMAQFLVNGATSREYRYNARGERVAKLNVPSPQYHRYYVYDEAGRLLGEYRPNGTRVAEYVWLDDTLVAVFSTHGDSNHQLVLTDHLGTPRAIVHPDTNAILWRWDLTASAFGDHAANQDPDGDGAAYTFNLRYPGQYYDVETGLHYNYFRDYDPSTGRYVQSDPIGLDGGLSTYSYVGASPLQGTDPYGLLDVQAQYGISQGAGSFRYKFTFQTNYWSDVAIDRLGRLTRGRGPNALSNVQGLAERTDGSPVGMSEIPFTAKRGLELCADIDKDLERIFNELFPGQAGEWINAEQAQQALNAFRDHLNDKIRGCGYFGKSCQDPYRRVSDFYQFNTMLQRSHARMDSYSTAVYARHNSP
jgi:RHS repeat-associated protein